MASTPAILRANRPDPTHRAPDPRADQSSWALLIRHARCAGAGLDPDQWFPVSAEEGKARQEAAEAIAICNSCLVRARCLALSEPETRQLLEASLTALAPHWSVPLPGNPYFTGREEVLEALHAQLGIDQAVALTQSSALHGLGGVG